MLIVLGALLMLALHVVPTAWGYAAVAAAVAFEVAEKSILIRSTRKIPTATGPETMVGRPATVLARCNPIGRVRCGRESWKARCTDPRGADVGETVVIDSIEGTTLLVSHRPVERTTERLSGSANAKPTR